MAEIEVAKSATVVADDHQASKKYQFQTGMSHRKDKHAKLKSKRRLKGLLSGAFSKFGL